tara:strand:+ start:1403 stop:3466 length:2064 start_codon:yes stop_codon:yes gene_type:complete
MVIGVDVGGTFTDVVLVSGEGRQRIAKAVTTPGDYSTGILNGVRDILGDGEPSDVERFILGTTVATNAVIEQKGARTAVLMTAGFEDTLEIGRQKRSVLYDLFLDPETPNFLAPRRQRLGIRERIDASGGVVTPLDEDQVRRAITDLVDQHGIEAVAVCYLFSFLNPDHERRTKEIIIETFPQLQVSISSDVDPVFREYERLCITALDAYLRPTMQSHLGELADALSDSGIAAELEVMQSRGGISSYRQIVELPARTVLSGPAAGVLGALHVAKEAGFEDIISLDMGGTSADIAVVKDGQALTTTDGMILQYPFRFPMIDCSPIGAGGGSIAWVDSVGSLHVGPQSAGAAPGPACYGRGGADPTVTDASIVLGWLNPDYFAGGTLSLDVDAAHKALETIAGPLSLSVPEAAWAIHAIVNAKMADEMRLWTVCRGYDPRDFALVLLGGAGPVNGGMVAKASSISTILVPNTPGVLSAFGLLVANIEHDNSAAFRAAADAIDVNAMTEVYRELDARGLETMAREGVPADAIRIKRSADLRYLGQSYELNVAFNGDVSADVIPRLVDGFHIKHKQVYGQHSTEATVEFVNLRAVHSYPLPKPKPVTPAGGSSWTDAKVGTRRAYFFPEFPSGIGVGVYDRTLLPQGKEVRGPLIIDQSDTTTVIYPGQSCRVDRFGNIVVTSPATHRNTT